MVLIDFFSKFLFCKIEKAYAAKWYHIKILFLPDFEDLQFKECNLLNINEIWSVRQLTCRKIFTTSYSLSAMYCMECIVLAESYVKFILCAKLEKIDCFLQNETSWSLCLNKKIKTKRKQITQTISFLQSKTPKLERQTWLQRKFHIGMEIYICCLNFR